MQNIWGKKSTIEFFLCEFYKAVQKLKETGTVQLEELKRLDTIYDCAFKIKEKR